MSARLGMGLAVGVAILAVAGWPRGGSDAAGEPAACPDGMARVDASLCVDRYEASLDELDDAGAVVRSHPPNEPVGAKRVRAKSVRGVVPQAYVSRDDADGACRAAGKRLCTDDEWRRACRGTHATKYPYGTRRRAGACNDRGVEPLAVVFRRPASATEWGFDTMNDPRLHLVPGGVSRTGRFDRCTNDLGVYDMVGNVHEWTSDAAGTFRGGWYLDTSELGEGCDYAAVGHDAKYRDYSTGFRCCRDAGG
jgi:formylglycine-generating enzyme required for sulfatase activity